MTLQIANESRLLLDVDSRVLTLNYASVSGKAIFDICSLEGRILNTGEVHLSGLTLIDVSLMNFGHYMIIIMDGDKIHRESFILAS